jgi:translocation and assembly module TamA
MYSKPKSRFALRRLASGLLVCGCLLSAPAEAAETLLVAPGAPDDLTARLQGASAVLATRDQSDVQDLLAAALSDYRTMVQVLYDAGYFAPVVNSP